MLPGALPYELWAEITADLEYKDCQSLTHTNKALRALPLPSAITVSLRSSGGLYLVAQQCLQAQALHVDVGKVHFDRIPAVELQNLLQLIARQPASPIEQLWVSGDELNKSGANHLWLYTLLAKMAQLRVFILSTDKLRPMPCFNTLVHLVLRLRELSPACPVCGHCRICNDWDDDDEEEPHRELSAMPCLQSLQLSWAHDPHNHHAYKPTFCEWGGLAFSSLQQLKFLMLENVAPADDFWGVPEGCQITLKGSPDLLRYLGMEEDLAGEPDGEEISLVERASQQLVSLHVTCPRADQAGTLMWGHADLDFLDYVSFSALRELRITCLGQADYPIAIGEPCKSLLLLQIHAMEDVHLALHAAVQPEVLDLSSLRGTLHVSMPDAESVAQNLVQLHVQIPAEKELGFLELLLLHMEARGLSDEYTESMVDIWSPACDEHRMAELLGCSCGACTDCLQRSGILFL